MVLAGTNLEHSSKIHLVADDYAPWREEVRSILKARPEWNVIPEASDGREAIEKAIETKPDVILLDLEMPNLNGIQAAKIIRQRCPKSKILFVTQDGDAEVRNAAMQVGASAYVLKADAGKELLDAITAAPCL